MKVIDISSWQENVDWDAVVAEGIEGVIIKIVRTVQIRMKEKRKKNEGN